MQKPEPPKDAPKPVEIPKVNAPVPGVSVPVPPLATGLAPSPVPTGPPTGAESHLVVGEQYEASIQNLMGMGFGR